MLELDQILRANELTVAVVAAIPSLAIAGGTGYLLIRWVTPSPPDRKSEALPARYCKGCNPAVKPGFRCDRPHSPMHSSEVPLFTSGSVRAHTCPDGLLLCGDSTQCQADCRDLSVTLSLGWEL